jgi:hypothetical protein
LAFLQGEDMNGMKEAVERVLQALHEDPGRYRPTPKKVRAIAEKVAPEEDPRALTREALRELRRRVREATEALWEALEVDSPPPPEVEKALERGESVRVFFPEPLPGRVVVHFWGNETMHFPSPLALRLGRDLKVDLTGSKGGDVAFAALHHALSARAGRVFLRGDGLERVREATEVARAFRPLFRAFGLEDLEGALEVLAHLKDGEAKMEGPYALARRGESRVLGRGIFGDPPAVGAAFFLGEEAVFRYPGDLEIGLKVDPVTLAAVLVEMRVRWEGETAQSGGALAYATPTERDLLGVLVRKGLERWLRDPFLVPESPKMRALLEELAESEDPITAPKDPGFFRRARLRALANL